MPKISDKIHLKFLQPTQSISVVPDSFNFNFNHFRGATGTQFSQRELHERMSNRRQQRVIIMHCMRWNIALRIFFICFMTLTDALIHSLARCLLFEFSFVAFFGVFFSHFWSFPLVRFVEKEKKITLSCFSRAVNGIVKFIESSRLASFDLATLVDSKHIYVARLYTTRFFSHWSEPWMKMATKCRGKKGEREK